jgi:hypothetical protein
MKFTKMFVYKDTYLYTYIYSYMYSALGRFQEPKIGELQEDLKGNPVVIWNLRFVL